MHTIVSLALLLALSLYSVQGLSCRCRPETCASIESVKQRCKGGLVDDVCHCCKTCAKVEGEVCGGWWDLDGRCDQGLVCSITGSKEYQYMSNGRCVRQQKTTTTATPSNKIIKFPTRWEKVFKTTGRIEQPTGSGEEEIVDNDDEFESSGLSTDPWTWLTTEPTTDVSGETDLPTMDPSEVTEKDIVIF